jgi:hypothetical protein
VSWIKFQYTPSQETDKEGNILGISYVPLLEVEFVNGDKKFAGRALVDSGAYMTLANAEIAKMLEISGEGCPRKPVSGIVGSTEGFVKEVSLNVKYFEGKITIPVLFVEGLRAGILLGHRGFFENYRVKFQADQNIFEITKAPSH